MLFANKIDVDEELADVFNARRLFAIGCAVGGYRGEPCVISRELARRSIGRPSARLLGWVGALEHYPNHVWELHPLVVREDSERDRFFDAPGAVKYGLCDEVLGEDADPEGRAVILERLGAWQGLQATPIESIEVSQAGGFGRTRFDAADAGVLALGYVTDYGVLTEKLRFLAQALVTSESIPARCSVHAEGVEDAHGLGVAVQHVVRSFDPCMVCTVH